MFVYYFDHIGKPLEVVAQGLCRLSQPDLADLVGQAYELGEAMRTRVSVANGFKLSKELEVRLGPPVEVVDGVVLPIHVRATGPASLFPRLEADIELTGLGPELTQLSLRGSYKPPMAFVGEAIDRLLLHRVAEAAVKALVEQLCAAFAQGPVGGRVAPPEGPQS
ncbi:MAG: hypothetical protein WEB00_13675 [Dehalococcoidia bacterium]